MTRSTKIGFISRGASMLFYPAALPLSSQTLSYVAGVIRRHRPRIGSPWRKLNPGRQALLVLAYLRRALQEAIDAGHAYVVLDGTLIPSTGWPRTARSTAASTTSTA
jgi:hypothetical protein